MRSNEIILNDGGMKITSVLDLKTGNPVVLNAREALVAKRQEQMFNSLGYEISITTLTAIIKRITTQKFATIPFADYMPVVVGEGAWMQNLIKYRTFSPSDNFEEGIVNTGANNSVLAKSNTGIDAINIKIINWANEVNYSLFDIQQAAASGNWDIIESLERSRKTNWDLGVQRTSFLGLATDTNIQGLLNQSGINSNTMLITKYISAMNTTEFNAFVQGIVDAYRTNNNFTAYPTHFIIPELDYNGLVSPVSPDFPVINKLSYLLEAFKVICQNPDFKIMPCFYADEVNNVTVSGLDKNRYTLLRYDQDSFSMNIPVNYNATQQNTLNGFQWQNVGYGQFTGVNLYRPLELLYFDFAV